MRYAGISWPIACLLLLPFCTAIGLIWGLQLISSEFGLFNVDSESQFSDPTPKFIGYFLVWFSISTIGIFIYFGAILFCLLRLTNTIDRGVFSKFLLIIALMVSIVYLATHVGLDTKIATHGLRAFVINGIPLSDAIAQNSPLNPLAYGIFINAANGMAILAGISIALAMVSTLGRSPSIRESNIVSEYSIRMIHLRHYLYLGAAIFVVGTLAMKAFLSLGGVFVKHDGIFLFGLVAFDYDRFSLGLLTYLSSMYFLILFSIYVPVLFIHRHRLFCLYEKYVESEDLHKRRHWLSQNTLIDGWNEHLKEILALLAPLAAGPMSTLFSELVGA